MAERSLFVLMIFPHDGLCLFENRTFSQKENEYQKERFYAISSSFYLGLSYLVIASIDGKDKGHLNPKISIISTSQRWGQ